MPLVKFYNDILIIYIQNNCTIERNNTCVYCCRLQTHRAVDGIWTSSADNLSVQEADKTQQNQ